jgi:hypothetical protein
VSESEHAVEGGAYPLERIELHRSARGLYYWKIVVTGPIGNAADRAVLTDEFLIEHYGDRASREYPELEQ